MRTRLPARDVVTAVRHSKGRQARRMQYAEGTEDTGDAENAQCSFPGTPLRNDLPNSEAGLPNALRHGLEALSGLDLSAVQVHPNSTKPAQLNAFAYTQGTHIYLAPGQDHQLPHEAWHVIQQARGSVRASGQANLAGGAISINTEPALEHEADLMGQRALDAGAQPEAQMHRAPTPLPASPPDSGVAQGRFYLGEEQLQEQPLKERLAAELQDFLVGDRSQADGILDALWRVYGQQEHRHMEVGAVVKTARAMRQKIGPRNAYTLLTRLAAIAPRDINTPENFARRIGADTRLSPTTRDAYMTAFKLQGTTSDAYAIAKSKVVAERAQWVDNNIQEADDELQQGHYIKSNHDQQFRSIALGRHFTKHKHRALFNKLEERVLGMRSKLVAAWYYNQQDDDRFGLFAGSELQSHGTRAKLAEPGQMAGLAELVQEAKQFNPTCLPELLHLAQLSEPGQLDSLDKNGKLTVLTELAKMADALNVAQPDEQAELTEKYGAAALDELAKLATLANQAGALVTISKSMSVDLMMHKTGHYFYSFIEHMDSSFNQNTRFTKPATISGDLGTATNSTDDARRLRIPLAKMAKAGAIIMGGDLAADRQETMKMKLRQNATDHKLFGPGYRHDKSTGLLINYLRFVEQRIYLAKPRGLAGWLVPQRGNTGQQALLKLEKMLGRSDAELWEYLVREIAQPQLLTPSIISNSMKQMQRTNSNNTPVA